MDYELAKQLKDAGWPQSERHWVWTDNQKVYIDVPTLSELIEACEPRIQTIEKDEQDGNLWCAYECTEDDYFEGRGKTPKEAVARLWLALHSSN